MRALSLKRGSTPDRAALVAAASKSGLSLRQLSVMIGRADSYLSQFIQRASPRVLPPHERRELARILQIPEEQITGPGARMLPELPSGQLSAGRTPAAATAPAAPPTRASRALTAQVEHMREGSGGGERFQLADTLEGVTDQAVAITLTRQHGLLLQPRSVLICEPTDSAKLGDLVALVAEGALESVGVLIPNAGGGGQAVLEGADTLRPVGNGQLWRIRAIRAA